jgi:predicted transcriptional regulator
MLKTYKGNTMKAFLIMMVLTFMAYGCASTQSTEETQSPTKIAYTTIKSAAIAYETVMSALGDLSKEGKITDEQKTMIIEYGNKFWTAYHTAVDALYAYKQSGEEINLTSSIVTLTSALSSFLEYSAEITK